MAKTEFTSQDNIDERAAVAHFEAFCAALEAGRTTAEAMQAAEAARRKINASAQA